MLPLKGLSKVSADGLPLPNSWPDDSRPLYKILDCGKVHGKVSCHGIADATSPCIVLTVIDKQDVRSDVAQHVDR